METQELKIGKLRASSISKIMGAKGMGKTGETYIYEVAAEAMTGEPATPPFTAASTEWGNKYELEAKLYYQSATGETIISCDCLDNGQIVGTPDGTIKEYDLGIEIKCPYNSGNHLKNLRLNNAEELKDLHPEYYWQIYAYMWLTGLDEWKFCSYDPRFKEADRMLILKLKQESKDMELLKSRVKEANELLTKIINGQ